MSSEYKILLQDVFPLEDPLECLLSVRVPFLIFLAKQDTEMIGKSDSYISEGEGKQKLSEGLEGEGV